MHEYYPVLDRDDTVVDEIAEQPGKRFRRNGQARGNDVARQFEADRRFIVAGLDDMVEQIGKGRFRPDGDRPGRGGPPDGDRRRERRGSGQGGND